LALALKALSLSEPRRTVSRLDLAASAPASQRVLVVLWGTGWVLFDDPYLAFPVSRHAGPTLSVSLV
jgi:acetyl esterase/lipase